MGTALMISTTTLAHAAVGQPYAATLAATGGTMPYSWALASGSLPAGLALSTDGQISGDAMTAGSATFVVQVTDGSSPAQVATASLTLIVDPAMGTALAISTTSLPDGMIGTAYTAQLMASGGTSPYTWSLGAGTALPSGLTLGADGSISGMPVQAGSTTFSVQVTDASAPQQAATGQLTLMITTGGGMTLSITTAALPHGTVGVAYSATIAVSGGTAPYGFSVASGALPPGLSLTPQGAIVGTPSQVGSFTLSIQCSDASSPQQVATRSYTLTVDSGGVTNPVSITTAALPNGLVGMAYTAQLAASGGTPPYQWSLEPASTLPPGLRLSAAGMLTGTPTVAGRFSFTLVVVDASMPQESASGAFTVTIAPAMGGLTVLTTALPDAVIGVPYNRMLRAAGGQFPFTWTLAAGALPPGIQLTAMGLLTGTPTRSTGAFDFNVQVTDSAMPAQVAQASLRLTVLPSGTTVLTITTGNLPNGAANQPYSAQLQARGGTAPYHWTQPNGGLPRGLSLSTTGLLSGTTTIAGRFFFMVQATDSGMVQQVAQRRLTLVVFTMAPTLVIANPGLPGGALGMMYNVPIRVRGGVAPYTLSVASGRLPPGLHLDSATLALTGTPTTAGSFTFTLAAADSEMPAQHAMRTYTVMIFGANGVRITTFALPGARRNTAYSATLNAAGGTAPYHWSLVMGTLPAGLTLSAAGVISGTPTTQGISAFSVQVTDSGTPASSAQRRFAITVQ
jgi:hypothetical protein